MQCLFQIFLSKIFKVSALKAQSCFPWQRCSVGRSEKLSSHAWLWSVSSQMFRALYLNRRNKAGCKYNAHFWDCYPETTLTGIKARNNKLCYFSIMKDFRFIPHMQQLIWFAAPGESQCFKNQSTPSVLGRLKWELVEKQNIWTWGSCPVVITFFLMQIGFNETAQSSFHLLLILLYQNCKRAAATQNTVRSRRKCFTRIVKAWWDKTWIVSHPRRAASRGSFPCLEHIHPELDNSKCAKPQLTFREAESRCLPAAPSLLPAWCSQAGWGEQQQPQELPWVQRWKGCSWRTEAMPVWADYSVHKEFTIVLYTVLLMHFSHSISFK